MNLYRKPFLLNKDPCLLLVCVCLFVCLFVVLEFVYRQQYAALCCASVQMIA